MEEAVLLQEWRHLLCVKTEVDTPERLTLSPQDYWPSMIQKYMSECPHVRRVIMAFLILEQQNAQVERDLGCLRAIRDATHGQLGDERYDHRCRILCSLKDVKKKRGERVTGILQDICLDWAHVKKRQHKLLGPREEPVGPQGRCPQRAPIRKPGSNRQMVEVEIKRPLPDSTEVEPVAASSLCPWLA